IVLEPLRDDPNYDDIILIIETKDLIDQDYTTLKLECYYLKTAQHLIPTTTFAKKGSILFINGELLINKEAFIVYLHEVNFFEYQKPINMKNLTNLLWLTSLNKSLSNESNIEKDTRTIALQVKKSKRRKILSTTRFYFNLKDCLKVVDLLKRC
ncbi:5925_t:CDS:1, partial [Scutellospora calospora]